MSDILLTQEQQELRDMFREFVHKEIIPVAAEYDEKGEFPREVFRKAVDMGLTTLGLPEAYGGRGPYRLHSQRGAGLRGRRFCRFRRGLQPGFHPCDDARQ